MYNYEPLKQQMEAEYEFLYKEIYVYNSYNCVEGEMKDKIVIDIGANTGYFSIYAIMMGAKKVYAFEPNKNNFAKLIERTKDFDNIIAINKAVHAEGVKKCYTVNDNNPELADIENGVRCEVREATSEQEGTIDCISLKEILSGINETVILKTDSEGSEYDFFLCSTRETLHKIDIIYSEFHDKIHPNASYNPEMLTDYIVNNGFERIECIKRWSTGVWVNGDYVPISSEKNGDNNYYRKFKRQPKSLSETVNIIIPTYKRYSLLTRALDSVLAQTYSDINVLVVADGKDLMVEKIVNEYKTKSDTIKFNYYDIPHEGKLGGSARIHGIEQLPTDGYVCFLDDDNTLYPKYVQLMKANIEAGKRDIVFCNVLLVEDGLAKSIPQSTIPTLEDIDSLNILVSNKIAKLCKDKWMHNGERITHDFDFISECMKHTAYNYIPAVLAEHNFTNPTYVEEPVTKSKIYDCFPFFNELDLLAIRFEELYDTVDKFVITEANATHSGKPKPLYLTENIQRFEKYKDKIEIIIVDLLYPLPNSNMNADWLREHIQRNDAMKYLNSVCKPEDIVIVSDADEIPRKEAIQQYINDKQDAIGVLVQDRFMYYLNYKNSTTDEPQLNSKITRFKLLNYYSVHDINAIRYADKENLMPTYRIENGGWHFTFMGGLEKVIEKVQAFAHQEYNRPEKINYERMLKNFNEGKDVYDAKTTWEIINVDNTFPKRVTQNIKEYVTKGWIKFEIPPLKGDKGDVYKITELPTIEVINLYSAEKKNILCSISTRGRYHTTLALAISAVAMQELLPDELVLFDDNDTPENLVAIQHYEYLFRILDEKGVKWSVQYGERKGQHFNHQRANKMDYKFVWRIDDDTIPEPDVLKNLYAEMKDDVGAVGGSILTPPFQKGIIATGKIENIRSEPNMQWDYITQTKEVDHLHCSFLYRAGIVDYDLRLSKVAHREESSFTYALKKAGYKILVTPCVTWHLRNKEGGIRTGNDSMFMHDEQIFEQALHSWKVADGNKLICLDCGLGDTFAFKHILQKLKLKHKKLTLAVCFNEAFDDVMDGSINLISIAEAKNILGDKGMDEHNIYKFMVDTRWKGNLVEAYEKLYLS